MFATTWSKPNATKIKTGIQRAMIFETTSLAPAGKPSREVSHTTNALFPKSDTLDSLACQTARHTSTLHPIPRKRIMPQVGVTTFAVANLIAYAA